MVGRKLAEEDASRVLRTFVLELLIWGLGTPRVSCTALSLEAELKSGVCSEGWGLPKNIFWKEGA